MWCYNKIVSVGGDEYRVQPLQNDHRQRRSVLQTSTKTLRPGAERERRRTSGVSHVVHYMQTNACLGHRSKSARSLSPHAAQRTARRVRQLQQVQIVAVFTVRRLQPVRQERHRRFGTVSGLLRYDDVRHVRLATTPSDHRPQKTVSLFQVQGNNVVTLCHGIGGNIVRKMSSSIKNKMFRDRTL